MFSQKCCLSLRPSAIQHFVTVQVVPNIRIIKQSQNNSPWAVLPWKQVHQNPSEHQDPLAEHVVSEKMRVLDEFGVSSQIWPGKWEQPNSDTSSLSQEEGSLQ
jgi:hypothetical protein